MLSFSCTLLTLKKLVAKGNSTMPYAIIENAIQALRKRRDEIDSGIRALESLNGGSSQATAPPTIAKKSASKTGKRMSAAVKAKLRIAYAKNHPGWKPKKK
jgi:hypothetical protein